MMRGDEVVGTEDSSTWWSMHPPMLKLEDISEVERLGIEIERALWSTNTTGVFSDGEMLVDDDGSEKAWCMGDKGVEQISEMVIKFSSSLLWTSSTTLPPSFPWPCKASLKVVPNSGLRRHSSLEDVVGKFRIGMCRRRGFGFLMKRPWKYE